MGFMRLFALGRQYDDFHRCELPQPIQGEKGSDEYETADKSRFLVTFEDHPEQNPKNWSFWYKFQTVLWVTQIGVSVAYASSVSSSATALQAEALGLTDTISSLATALFLMAFGVGTIPFAPLSEVFGRVPIYIVTLTISGLFEMGAGAAQSGVALNICRFFSGFFASVVLAICGGSVNDIADPIDRVFFFSVYGITGVMAPIFAPVTGGFVANRAGWRWTYWHAGIHNLVVAAGCLLWCPETLTPALLKRKAVAYRKRSGDNRFHATSEANNVKKAIKKAIMLPPKFLVYEPFCQLGTVYLSVAFFVIFGYLKSLPVVFGEVHHLSPEQIGLTFLPITLGVFLGWLPSLYFKKRYERLLVERNGLPPLPEERMLVMILGGPFITISLFWMGWTHFEHISVWSPIMSGLFIGFGFINIFMGITQMTMDVYEANASAAMVVLVVIRYIIAGIAVLTNAQMFRAMGPEWAATMLALISLLCFAATVLFYIYGPTIRSWSRYAKGIDLKAPEEQNNIQLADQQMLERRKTDQSQRSVTAALHIHDGHGVPTCTGEPPMSPVLEAPEARRASQDV